MRDKNLAIVSECMKTAPIKYVGLHVKLGKLRLDNQSPLVNCLEYYLAVGKSKFHPRGGRLVLVNYPSDSDQIIYSWDQSMFILLHLISSPHDQRSYICWIGTLYLGILVQSKGITYFQRGKIKVISSLEVLYRKWSKALSDSPNAIMGLWVTGKGPVKAI